VIGVDAARNSIRRGRRTLHRPPPPTALSRKASVLQVALSLCSRKIRFRTLLQNISRQYGIACLGMVDTLFAINEPVGHSMKMLGHGVQLTRKRIRLRTIHLNPLP